MENVSDKPIKNWVLGLTGGIGCGKSAVSAMFEQLGITVVDADIIARQVVAPNSNGLAAISEHFGTIVLNPDGSLNRAKLREIIFADNAQKTWLNNLLHPLIREKTLNDLSTANSAYVVLVAPLLFENGLEQYCDRTLIIDVPVEIQISRTIARDNIDRQQALSIIAAQMSREEKLHRADDVVDNNQPLALVAIVIQQLHTQYLTLAAKK
ncbi:MAG TPA: dephospho-CoA kinase [Pseudoalteromonas prydzensis]|uniref:Dephospho-CoA kinase n=1 Tax=Pseudoalteromonas prydzensis TaxID=182141 RepID=A0A7V1GD73_9GAMM|nr:dephospho-CoA kinase [Pseudoalteromonas prydzensis]HEA15368.1 dephospho-CoA kinase [Pseudoalteromonas prydzensis]